MLGQPVVNPAIPNNRTAPIRSLQIGVWAALFIWIISAAIFPPALAGDPGTENPVPCRPDLSSPTGLPDSPTASPFTDPCISPNPQSPIPNPRILRIPFADDAALGPLTGNLDIWEVDRKRGEVVALVYPSQERWLQLFGYTWAIDEAMTAALAQPVVNSAAQTSGIPYFTCYRTVTETYGDLADLAANRPEIVQWVDIGDSYDKMTEGGPPGQDMRALVLTNRASTAAEKGKLVVMAALHAREYATAELATRFAGKLTAGYGVDPDITWLLDYNEIHIIPQANPDGRGWAEQGYSWRKNTDRPATCASGPNNAPYSYGVDLNRNSTFLWNTCGNGGCSSGDPCSVVYRGASAGSEPEVQAIEAYLRSVFTDQRGPDKNDAAPPTTNGVFISLHSYGNLVIYSWDHTGSDAPNMQQLRRLGRKMGYFNRYSVCNTSNCLYAVDGSTTDFAYGEFGVATYTFEMGSTFFQSCSSFESSIVQQNLDALLYAAKAARRPYQVAAGPDTTALALSPPQIAIGEPLTVTATLNDTRYYSNGYGVEPSQAITAARYSLDRPSWENAPTQPISATDGLFDTPSEAIQSVLDTSGWCPGRHSIFVEGQDAAGNWGVPSAAFVTVSGQTGLDLDLQQTPPSADVISGETITHTLTLTNTGSQLACFALSVYSTTWPAFVSNQEIPLRVGTALSLPVTASVPLTASVGMTNVTVVEVRSLETGEILTATLQAVVTREPTSEPGGTNPQPLFLPWVHND